jgi:CheY-like chemotaxis protein
MSEGVLIMDEEYNMLHLNPAMTRLNGAGISKGSIKEDQQKCLTAGMDDFLAKPVLPETLEKMVLKWINHAPAKDGTSR